MTNEPTTTTTRDERREDAKHEGRVCAAAFALVARRAAMVATA